MVYVISKNGQPLMPTERHGKVRKMLESGKAKVVKRTPFTIQLQYETSEYVQPVTLGVDPGYKSVGLSAVTDTREVFAAETKVRTNIPKLLATRRMYRRTRRGRKTRYRKARFSNRVGSKPKGWLAPSVENRIQFHLKLVNLVSSILPVTEIVIESAQFDMQKLKNPAIGGKKYQEGDQSGFWNTREYVLWRDSHKCQHCKGKSRDPVLQVHHLESRKTGGNRPGNLLTLCKTCHGECHAGLFALPKPRAGFKAAAHVNIMRKKLYEKLKALDIPVGVTFGYQTKGHRISQGLPKTHINDAFVIAGGVGQLRTVGGYLFRQVRKQNRKLYRGIRSHLKNKVARVLFGFQLWDKVRYKGQEYFIKARRSSGYFCLSDIFGHMVVLDGKKLSAVKHCKLVLIRSAATLLRMEV